MYFLRKTSTMTTWSRRCPGRIPYSHDMCIISSVPRILHFRRKHIFPRVKALRTWSTSIVSGLKSAALVDSFSARPIPLDALKNAMSLADGVDDTLNQDVSPDTSGSTWRGADDAELGTLLGWKFCTSSPTLFGALDNVVPFSDGADGTVNVLLSPVTSGFTGSRTDGAELGVTVARDSAGEKQDSKREKQRTLPKPPPRPYGEIETFLVFIARPFRMSALFGYRNQCCNTHPKLEPIINNYLTFLTKNCRRLFWLADYSWRSHMLIITLTLIGLSQLPARRSSSPGFSRTFLRKQRIYCAHIVEIMNQTPSRPWL